MSCPHSVIVSYIMADLVKTTGLDAFDVIRIADSPQATVKELFERASNLLKEIRDNNAAVPDFTIGVGYRRVRLDLDGEKLIPYFEPFGANWFLHVFPLARLRK